MSGRQTPPGRGAVSEERPRGKRSVIRGDTVETKNKWVTVG